jgi:hypothetical protein
MWLAGIKTWARLALVVPIVALVLLLVPAEIKVEASLGAAKIKPIIGHRELAALFMALLILKLARDANRLASCWHVADIELSESTKLDCFIRQDYVRPIDLVRQCKQSLLPGMLFPLRVLEAARGIVVGVVALAVAGFSIVVLIATLANMIRAPILPPPLSYGLAALILGLLAAAVADVIAMGLLPLLIPIDRWLREVEKRRWCEREAKALDEPLPERWPASPAEQRKLEERIHERRRERGEIWDETSQSWSPVPRRRHERELDI